VIFLIYNAALNGRNIGLHIFPNEMFWNEWGDFPAN